MKKSFLLKKYLHQYRCIAAVLLLFVLIFAGVLSLYDMQAEAVAYAALICVVLAIIILAVNFTDFCRRHKEREFALNNILIMTDELPAAKNLAEEELCEMIVRLKEINHSNMTKYQNERTESIDYYTAWVHQIKTPISVMQMILQGEDSDEHRELCAELFRIEQYVEMALCYFRLDSSSSDFVFKRLDLNQVIRSAIHKFAPQFVRKRIKLKYEPTAIEVLSDEKWLSFIIEQILSNAVKYTESGQVSIAVSSDKILSISDTGIGIASEDIPRIFEKGFTGYNGRINKKSTGLGLYLCKKAADKLSHKLSVESSVGKGSTFSIDMRSDNIEIE